MLSKSEKADYVVSDDLYVVNVRGPRGGHCGWAIVRGENGVERFKDQYRGRRFYKGIATTFEVSRKESTYQAHAWD